MKSILSLSLIIFALTFCGLGERIKQLQGSSESASNSSSSPGGKSSTSETAVEEPKLTSEQQAIADAATQVKWDEQGISWKLPAGWKKMQVMKEQFNYGSPDNAFLIGTISVMPDSFPSETSLEATYNSALEQLKQGKYASVRYLEIDGVKGVEWTEAMPEQSDSPRRHQWIAFRKYLGQNQQLNMMLSTKGSNFEKHRNDFPAIMYSMKIPKG